MKGKIVLIILFMVCANSGIAGADYLLIDQSYMPNVDGWYNLSYYEFHQEFRPSVLSLINKVEVRLHTNEDAIPDEDLLCADSGIYGAELQVITHPVNGWLDGCEPSQRRPATCS